MATIYAFGPFRLEADADTLFRGAEPVALGGRAVALLRLLLEKAGKPVAKDALMEAAWPGLAIEESNLTVQIAALRRAFAAVEGGSTWIETLPRRGYRYVGPPATNLSDASRQTWLLSATSDKPSIAVLPFLNLSGDPAQDYFSDGITEDIITELSRFRSLLVVARHSSFAYRARSSDIREVGRQLGVRYVAEGSARRIGKRVRVTVKLLDAASGFTLWTERYDREIEDIFAIQDEIVGKIVSALPGRLEDAGREIARGKQTSNITAYDLVLLGNEKWRQLTVRSMEEARGYFQKAIGLDPAYARAHANIAWTVVCAAFLESPAAPSLDEARSEIEIALDLDEHDAWSHSVFAQLLFLQNRDQEAETHFKRALALNPNDADRRRFCKYSNLLGALAGSAYMDQIGQTAKPISTQYLPLVPRAGSLFGSRIRTGDQSSQGSAIERPLVARAPCGVLRANKSTERSKFRSGRIRSREISGID
ncbi:TolB-like protein [Bradyrhizobium sp. LA2.1]